MCYIFLLFWIVVQLVMIVCVTVVYEIFTEHSISCSVVVLPVQFSKVLWVVAQVFLRLDCLCRTVSSNKH